MKLVVLWGTILLSPSLIRADPRRYTHEEIAIHNSEKSCWLIIENKVYDVTTYIPKHPAPKKAIIEYCSKEATKAFRTKNKNEDHSKRAKKLLESLLIGELIAK